MWRLGNNSTKIKENCGFGWMLVNTCIVLQVTADFSVLNQDHDRFVTKTKSCECLNVTMKKF